MNPANRQRGSARNAARPALALLLFLLLSACVSGRSEAQTSGPAPDAAGATSILINELLTHTDPPQVDSVEFYNPTDQPISMAGWWFSDDGGDADKLILPTDALVPANGYWVLKLPEGGALRLKEEGETVTLTAVDGSGAPTGAKETVEFGAAPNGVSVGRVVTSDGVEHYPLQRALTLGAPNAGPRVGPIVIAEIMYNPAGGKPEYIELVNTSDQTVLLYDPTHPQNRWTISGVDSYAIPTERLAPGASLLVAGASPSIFRNAYNLPGSVAVTGPFAGSLKNDGERIALLSPEPPNLDGTVPFVVVDEVEYGTGGSYWPSEPNGTGPALARTALNGFGQEPANWGASALPLEAGPAASASRAAVLATTGGGRVIQWSTAYEWLLTGFTLWRSPEGSSRDEALQIGGLVLPQGNRHLGSDYAVIDAMADAEATYTYWIEAQTTSASTLALAAINSPPPTLVMLPIVKQ